MPRIKIILPPVFTFSTNIPLRITDINYGGHVGNDTILSILHEARIQFLIHFGYQELNIGGVGLIMKEVAIDFKKEIFYGEKIRVWVTAFEFTRYGFELYYKLEKESSEVPMVVAIAKTGMICYDYSNKKIVPLPEIVKLKLS